MASVEAIVKQAVNSYTTGHYDGSNVNLLIEIADAREAQRSYEANLKLFDQVRQMSTSLMELLRR